VVEAEPGLGHVLETHLRHGPGRGPVLGVSDPLFEVADLVAQRARPLVVLVGDRLVLLPLPRRQLTL
jgi:hypothetical protein